MSKFFPACPVVTDFNLVVFYTTLYYLSLLNKILVYNFFEVIFLKPLKEKISITIDSDVLEKLRISAENDDRSLSQYINLILKSYIHKENPECDHSK